jgi:RNA polymerase sigma-70 factor (ECF subfamily)
MSVAEPRFEDLIQSHHDEIHRYLWRWALTAGGPDPEADAQDLTQETFLRAFNAFDRLRPGSNPRAWLYKIATNCAHSAWREHRRTATVPDGHLESRPDPRAVQPERHVVELGRDRDLRAALAQLPLKQQAAVTLRHLQGLDYTTIAQALDCSDESARANVYQGLKKLRQTLGAREEV